jgi:hypothetical protein
MTVNQMMVGVDKQGVRSMCVESFNDGGRRETQGRVRGVGVREQQQNERCGCGRLRIGKAQDRLTKYDLAVNLSLKLLYRYIVSSPLLSLLVMELPWL